MMQITLTGAFGSACVRTGTVSFDAFQNTRVHTAG